MASTNKIGVCLSSIVLQFKISLDENPPIWRRVLVPGDYAFKDLHFVIQSVMGWSDKLQHKFEIIDRKSGEILEIADLDEDNDHILRKDPSKVVPESISLAHHFRSPNDKAFYQYHGLVSDFSKKTIIIFEKILQVAPGKKYPRCVAGRRASPPENHDYEDFDPEAFDHMSFDFRKCRSFLQKPQGFIDFKAASTSKKNGNLQANVIPMSPTYIAAAMLGQISPLPSEKNIIHQIQRQVKASFSAQNSKLSLPQKRSRPQQESNLPKTKHRDKNCDKPIENSTDNSEDLEDNYGKYIASQIRKIEDLEARENLRIEIQQVIKKYRFKKI